MCTAHFSLSILWCIYVTLLSYYKGELGYYKNIFFVCWAIPLNCYWYFNTILITTLFIVHRWVTYGVTFIQNWSLCLTALMKPHLAPLQNWRHVPSLPPMQNLCDPCNYLRLMWTWSFCVFLYHFLMYLPFLMTFLNM